MMFASLAPGRIRPPPSGARMRNVGRSHSVGSLAQGFSRSLTSWTHGRPCRAPPCEFGRGTAGQNGESMLSLRTGAWGAPVAQLDRASDYESEGRRFKSCRVHHDSSSSCKACEAGVQI